MAEEVKDETQLQQETAEEEVKEVAVSLMDQLSKMNNNVQKVQHAAFDEDWPLSNRKPICGEVEIPKSLKEKVKSVMFRNKIKNYESQSQLGGDAERIYAKSTL